MSFPRLTSHSQHFKYFHFFHCQALKNIATNLLISICAILINIPTLFCVITLLNSRKSDFINTQTANTTLDFGYFPEFVIIFLPANFVFTPGTQLKSGIGCYPSTF